jgi:hypothetical protein
MMCVLFSMEICHVDPRKRGGWLQIIVLIGPIPRATSVVRVSENRQVVFWRPGDRGTWMDTGQDLVESAFDGACVLYSVLHVEAHTHGQWPAEDCTKQRARPAHHRRDMRQTEVDRPQTDDTGQTMIASHIARHRSEVESWYAFSILQSAHVRLRELGRNSNGPGGLALA